MAENIVVQPRIAARNPNKQIKFVIATVVILALIGVLIVTTIRSTGAYYLTVDEIVAQSSDLVGKKVRMSGAVLQDSERWDAANLMLTFDLAGTDGNRITVSFHGSRPSNFSRATEAIVEGELQPDGVFRADTLMLKCPSRYEEAPEVTEFKAIQ
ncbi:MAG: cytochrome c maturation protein CcmE [Anaerolineae bacterium]|nr:cytochrome c maturation protein CcmE [Caldilineales bacterium]MDW8268724.1 cytochrome c maturation protein CcmE [Anaerolineae bacterium]